MLVLFRMVLPDGNDLFDGNILQTFRKHILNRHRGHSCFDLVRPCGCSQMVLISQESAGQPFDGPAAHGNVIQRFVCQRMQPCVKGSFLSDGGHINVGQQRVHADPVRIGDAVTLRESFIAQTVDEARPR